MTTEMNAPLHHSRNRRPRDIYSPFTVTNPTPTVTTFLPPVLWPCRSKEHHAVYREELREAPHATDSVPSSPPALLSYNPITPYIFRFGATGQLPPHDLLYYTERFFGTCLIDRTGTLTRSHPVRILDPIPPFHPSFNKSLTEICDRRARDIFARAEHADLDVRVMWSGGIDSTAALVALLRVSTERQRQRLVIVYETESISEYRLFYYMFIRRRLRKMKIKHVTQMFSRAENERDFLIVTGELGDQIFGSLFYALTVINSPTYGGLMSGKTDAPWRGTMATVMERMKAIPPGAGPAWEAYVEPLVAKAPIPIRTMFDFLWWMNYSCKWQVVVVRFVARQWEPSRALMDKLEHFFRDPDFEQWSFHNHQSKMTYHTVWTSYKAPLKNYIFLLTQDQAYRDRKTKVISLGRLSRDPSRKYEFPFRSIGLDENFNHVSFGRNSITLDSLRQRYQFTPQSDGFHSETNTQRDGNDHIAEGQLWEDEKASKRLSRAQFSFKQRMKMNFSGGSGSAARKVAINPALRQWTFLHYTTTGTIGINHPSGLGDYCGGGE